MTQAGQPAPDFTLPRDGGGQITLSDLHGRPVVLYFYPRDDTSGCTREALEFTEKLAEFEKRGIRVMGVSKDPVAKHDRFRDKHRLGVTLLSDADSDVCQRYGVWVEKHMYGKKHMGIERATFLIAPDGTVAQTWRRVKVPGHVDQVLSAVQAL